LYKWTCWVLIIPHRSVHVNYFHSLRGWDYTLKCARFWGIITGAAKLQRSPRIHVPCGSYMHVTTVCYPYGLLLRTLVGV